MQQLQTQLTQAQQQHLYRSRQIVDGAQGVEINLQGKSYLSFCSNDYLGLANHPDVRAAFKQGVDQYGVGSAASHLTSGHQAVHHQLEQQLAEFVQRPRVLLFSSGYMANLGVLSALLNRSDGVFQDKLNHASLIDAARLSAAQLKRYAHNNIEMLHTQLAASTAKHKLIACDGVFSMDGDTVALPQIISQAKQHDAWIMIDDAHGLGVSGNSGRGTLQQFNATIDDVPILMGTLGKAFGTFGAFVAASDTIIETLIQQARSYIYTTALPAAVASATLASLQHVINDDWRREHLRQRVQQFKTAAKQLGLTLLPSDTAIQPLILGSAETALKISAKLRQKNILISAIRPPTVAANRSRLRITFSANHTEQHVDVLLTALESLLPELTQHVC